MKNTRIWYFYKDLQGRQKGASIVVGGLLTEDDKLKIARSLLNGSKFIPSQVGIQPLNGMEEHDQVWHTLDMSMASPTLSQVSVEFTTTEMVERFSSTVWNPSLETTRMFAPESAKPLYRPRMR